MAVIVFLRGTVHAIGAGHVDLDVNGIGYRVYVPAPVTRQVALGREAFLHTHRYVREDSDELYGFLDERDRDWFEMLLRVSGIGPKGALQIVSDAGRDEFFQAVMHEDAAALCRLPGVGKKTAQRIILELREKVSVVKGTATGAGEPWTPQTALLGSDAHPEAGGLAADVIEALIGLGYNEKQAYAAVAAVFEEGKALDAAEALRGCLRYLSGARA
ncbi:Holliday junction branch migration protein RuvA [Alicyclobacillus kakegawensis]|uniref:Holliday junction branch migration protein RuvA n=1 Tax=Alicyclobacillus kakegawensis TaxID=392012 RepID=UPI000836E0A7|nr:Holliday junction branch migration protein RuvA [Alicyclobacillus kakegawensis]